MSPDPDQVSSGNILVVDDEPEMRDLLKIDLERRGFTVTTAASADEVLGLLAERAWDVVLTDLVMPGVDGLALCGRITSDRPDLPVVVMTAFGSLETAIEALRASAFDFVTKPLDTGRLALALTRAVEHRRLVEQVRILSHPVAPDPDDDQGELIGSSPAMQRTRERIRRIAATEASVLITGESGSGKELAAREICRHSRRREGPFVAVNCAALPQSLIESELFGHARGAFTDARTQRVGLFEEARGGTLFLDEIGEVPLEVQPKLLRALENHAIRPVGANREVVVDVRVLAATNRDLLDAISEGTFRADLYYRINVISLQLPPLRERGPEILELTRHFLGVFGVRYRKRVVGLTESAARRLLDYPWPGNVRELRNAIEAGVALAAADRITLEDLPEGIRSYGGPALGLDAGGTGGLPTLAELERRHILQALQAAGGKKSRAAEILGLDRKTLYRKLQRLGEP